MNRYVIKGLTADLLAGKLVYVVSDRREHAERVVQEVAGALAAGGEPLTSRRGRIEARDGLIEVVAARRGAFKGARPDVVVVLNWDGLTAQARDGLLDDLEQLPAFDLIRF